MPQIDENTFTLEEIDRTLYNIIRQDLVATNHLPDITNRTAYPDNAAGRAAYEAALEALGANLIGVYGVGGGIARGKKEINRITIKRVGSRIGTIGANGLDNKVETVEGEAPADKRWNRRRMPDNTRHVMYELRAITSTTDADRVCSELLYEHFGSCRHIESFVDYNTKSGKHFLLTSNGDDWAVLGMGGNKDVEWVERVFRFTVTDVWLVSEFYTDPRSIVPLTHVEFLVSINFDKHETTVGKMTEPDDTIVVEP